MKSLALQFILSVCLVAGFAASALQAQLPAPAVPETIIPVNSPAFVFSPGNWTGDSGRGGSVFRQTWYPGAYFRVTWTTFSATPTAELLLDTSTYVELKNKPVLTYNLDGVWTAHVPCTDRIPLDKLTGAGPHTLTIYLSTSDQTARWGSPGKSGLNVVRVTGLRVDADDQAGTALTAPRWALIVGDSITEGSAADFGKSDNLACWSYFVGQGLMATGMEYGVSACGWSGWLRPGDRPADVPAYYQINNSSNDAMGKYDDAASRWNKIDGNGHSLLDASGHLSAYGKPGQEPSMILINYGTNDALSNVSKSDFRASVTQCLTSLRGAAPQALIFVIIPFGQFGVETLHASVADYRSSHPTDAKVGVIDLGAPAAKALGANDYWSGLHPNMRGHATFAAQILAEIFIRPRPPTGH